MNPTSSPTSPAAAIGIRKNLKDLFNFLEKRLKKAVRHLKVRLYWLRHFNDHNLRLPLMGTTRTLPMMARWA